MEKKDYTIPQSEIHKVDAQAILSSSSNGSVLHDMNTQKDRPGPGIGGDEEHEGDDDLEG